ncbi:glycoside hydrolase domain-containing protein [Catenibacterium mitsuokai]|uniref:glycoside hydrolase domain-containing protein n=1 Tax=Catenibacterium mitsuokai TaxID=100886 RepID=UPI003F8DB310
MADENVRKAQKYLNSMYGHRSEWVKLDEDGLTGTGTCKGIIRAFQIENGISPVTGTVGNITLNKMRSLSDISKMNANDPGNPNVCILQCALFVKGYNAGGITGVYYTAGVNAVKQYQEDAGLPVTGIIDWKVWMGLVSINWFKKTNAGDKTIVKIQQQLNTDWSDVIGVGPCDGVVSRFTSYALIAALQAAEGIYTSFIGSIDKRNFGDQTVAKFPGVLKQGKNGTYVKYNKLVQYGLYLNGYDAGRFDGNFDSTTKSMVESFQEFYALTGIGLVTSGEVNCATMKSLLTSKGDTGRKAKACDCSTVLNKQQALDIKNAGYQVVGRYLTGTANGKRKFITFEEIKNIESAGLRVFPIYQDGGYKAEYFQNLRQGIVDAHTAITAAKRIGVPDGTTIYFAVDFDCYDYQMKSFIVPYFKKLNLVFDSETNNKKYKVGIYAPRYICSYISKKGLAEYSFVADMSSGYSCNLGYPIPKNWAFDQFFEFNVNNGGQFPSSPSFDLDKVGYSGRDKGITTFDKMPYMSPDQLAEKNSNIILDIQRDQYVYNVFEPLGYLDKVYNSSLTYKKEFLLDTILLNGLTIKITAEVSGTLTTNFDSTPITIDLNNEGELTASCEAEIEGMIAGMEIKDFENIDIINSTINDLKDVAKSVTSGQIGVKVNLNGTYPKLTFVITTKDIFPDSAAVDQEITVEISFEIIPNPTPDVDYKLDKTTLAKCALSVAAVIGLIAFLSNPGTAPLATEYLMALGVVA